MNKLPLVMISEYLVRVRSRAFIISTLLGPILLLAISLGPALLASRTSEGARTVMVIDDSGDSGLFTSLQGEIGDPQVGGERNIRLQLWGEGNSLDSALTQLAPEVGNGNYDGVLYIPPSFLQKGDATLYGSNPSGVVWADPVEDALGRVLIQEHLKSYGIDKSELDRVMMGANLHAEDIARDKTGKKGSMEMRLAVGFVLVFLLYMMILAYGIQSMNSVIEDKTSRVVEVMLASVTPTVLMAGKIVASALVGLTQFAIWGIIATGLIGQGLFSLPANLDLSFLTPAIWLAFAAFFLLGYLLFACLYAAIGALCNSTQDAQQFQMPVTILVVIPMLLLQVVMQNPNGSIAVVFSLIPVFTPIMMFVRIALGNPPLWQIILSLVLLAATVGFMAKVTGKLFRLSILSFGKSPSWKQVVRMLRSPE
ncbi:MAG TPA: ABC transporter permease [Candidatus Krumholzibacteria bacterium]|nr:ABC transporter permease [Candidatus Krumholzibacteria bacterium]